MYEQKQKKKKEGIDGNIKTIDVELIVILFIIYACTRIEWNAGADKRNKNKYQCVCFYVCEMLI